MGQVRQSKPRFRRPDEPAPIALTDYDLALLRRVYRHRFIATDDLFRLFADRSPDRLSRRLMQLYRAGYLDRPLAQIDRFRGGGSRPLVYGLDNAGARLLSDVDGLRLRSGEWRSRNRAYTRENLDHTLATTRFLVDLELSCRARDSLEFLPFETVLAAAPEATRELAQPDHWTVSLSWGGGTGSVAVAPDAIFGLRQRRRDGSRVGMYAFLELDRGTMTIVPAKRVRESAAFLYRATLLRKLLTYAQSHLARIHQEHFGLRAVRVLFLTKNRERAEAIRVAAERFVVRPARLPAGLFLFGADDQTGSGGPVWVDASGAEVTLIP